jgi:hypothetical protein
LIVSIFKDNFNINLIPHIGAATLIAVIISYYYLEIIENLHLIIKYFLILVIPIMAINIFQAINYSLSDGSLFLKQLFFNCDNSVINFGKFFFKENSHFGLIATPVLLSYMFLEERLKDKFYNSFFIIFIIINIVFFSTTLIVSIIFCCLLYFFYFIFISFIDVKNSNFNNENLIIFSKKNLFFKILFKKSKNLLLIILIPLFLIYQPTCEKKVMETVYLITKVENEVIKKESTRYPHYIEDGYEVNASSSTYYYTLLVALEAFKKFPLGVGFNDYYFAYTFTKPMLDWFVNKESPRKIHDYAENVNQHDGYNNFAKLTVEFGILVLLLVPIVLKFLFSNKINLFIKFFILSLILTQLLKGVGYFNGGFLFGMIFMLITVYLDKKINV